MSTCPTKEIHSLYLDNELPLSHREQYEAHVAECPACKAQLEKLTAIRDLFKKDADAVSPDKKFMDESYERLMLKMKYSKNTSHVSAPKISSRTWKIVVPAVAAIAVLALAIPLKLATGKANVKTMSATSSLYSQVPSQVTEQVSNVAFGGENVFGNTLGESFVTNVGSKNVSNTNGAASKLIQDVEVFRPNFDGEQKTISIRITVPGNDDVPVTTEIEVPLDVTGQN